MSPPPAKLIAFVALASTLPFWMNEGELFSYGLYTLIFALLALGLNVVVGFAGLLDLGYVAFYGIGAYGYALLSSRHYGIHWQAEFSIPIVVAGTALVGLLLGLTSRRLLGDYLAIVTLFFGQAFVAFVNNANPKVAGEGLTGGPNGIPGVDPLNFFGYKLHSTKQYYFLLLIVFSLAMAGLYFLSHSRTGRAWKALREDPLAAETMSIPVNRLKIMAFMFGAGTAGLAGCIFAAIQTGVVAGNFDVALLITLYAIVILGGLGSIAGVLVGAIVINVSLQFLAPSNDHPELKRWLFYGVIVLIVARIRPWARLAARRRGHGRVRLRLPCGRGRHRLLVDGRDRDGRGIRRNRNRALGGHPAGTPGVRHVGLHHPGRADHRDRAGARLVAVRVIDPDAVLGRRRLGERPRRTAGGDGAHPLRRAADRADAGQAAGLARHGAGGDRMTPLLELEGLTKSFGGLRVIDDLDLLVNEGEVVSVIGPNGAGKTTLFNLITGIYRPDEGEIRLDGRNVVGLAPNKITKLGVARTFQTLRLFLNMSVKENVMAAQYGRTKAGPLRSILRTPGMRREEKQIAAQAEEKLSFFGQRLMGYRWDQPAYSLSYANRRRLEIARAMATEPRILLLDEPAAGMNPVETHEITELIGKLRDEAGYTILVIEHDMHVVEGISNRVAALDHGVKIAEGSFEQVATDPRVVEAYLGIKGAAEEEPDAAPT